MSKTLHDNEIRSATEQIKDSRDLWILITIVSVGLIILFNTPIGIDSFGLVTLGLGFVAGYGVAQVRRFILQLKLIDDHQG